MSQRLLLMECAVFSANGRKDAAGQKSILRGKSAGNDGKWALNCTRYESLKKQEKCAF